ncbi:hypothetical protein E2C01_028726 [Portunus trituberculatus]|uniref:Uncharacterized protein n=1 Tax=Portunus trituberculatus TaxID=210409 RepID=A0A5B7EQS2_PORTR|nr:hypothetical protein [Portunus trituberculatus]
MHDESIVRPEPPASRRHPYHCGPQHHTTTTTTTGSRLPHTTPPLPPAATQEKTTQKPFRVSPLRSIRSNA